MGDSLFWYVRGWLRRNLVYDRYHRYPIKKCWQKYTFCVYNFDLNQSESRYMFFRGKGNGTDKFVFYMKWEWTRMVKSTNIDHGSVQYRISSLIAVYFVISYSCLYETVYCWLCIVDFTKVEEDGDQKTSVSPHAHTYDLQLTLHKN